jgi:hypothetical protein
MNPRAALASLFLVSLLCLPATASQPEGLAAQLITDLGDFELSFPGMCQSRSFEWYEYFNSHQLEPTDMVTLEMAILPFESGGTFVGLDAFGGPTFMGIEFSDGLVHGLPYHRSRWNDVVVQLRPATQVYLLTVNGAVAGPFPYAGFCRDQGGCFTVQALRLHGHSNQVGSVARIDTISITRESAAGLERLFQFTFDSCFPRAQRPYVVGGVILINEPPPRLRSSR